MRISIQAEIFEKLPKLHSNFIYFENLKFKEGKDHELYDGLNEVFSRLRGHGGLETVTDITDYENLLEELGLKHAQVSTRSMINLIVAKKKDLILHHPIIDAYNYFSLHSLTPIGAYDVDRISGNMEIRFTSGVEKFKKLNKETHEEVSDSLVFSDSNEVMCLDWVSKQSDTQKIRPRSQNILFRIESLKDEIENQKLIDEFTAYIEEYFEYTSSDTQILSADNLEIEFKQSQEVLDRMERYQFYTDLLERGVSDVIVKEDLMADLVDGKMLKIKHGVDPTTKDLHLGYAVNYEKLRAFQQRGHTIQFLIGSFTGRFGDPSDKLESRNMRDKKTVMDLAKAYIDQVSMVLDRDKLEVIYNGDWYDKMSAEDLLRLMSKSTVARMLERDMFQKRIEQGASIGLHELVYPLLQGYDSVEMESDLTVIGTDQTFNELQARPLQEEAGQKPQNIIAMKLLVGTDGTKKMSQSLGNYIAFSDTANDKYGKLMSIPDHLILTYAESLSRFSKIELENLRQRFASGTNPRDLKAELALHIVGNFDGEENAKLAAEHFKTVFKDKKLPDDIDSIVVDESKTVLEIMMLKNLISSNSEGRRLIEQGGVSIFEGEKINSHEHTFKTGFSGVLKVGKRKFLKIVVE
ncbi:MAG: tyrosine--tRNA ligase [Crocinitomicaceae bacterium]